MFAGINHLLIFAVSSGLVNYLQVHELCLRVFFFFFAIWRWSRISPNKSLTNINEFLQCLLCRVIKHNVLLSILLHTALCYSSYYLFRWPKYHLAISVPFQSGCLNKLNAYLAASPLGQHNVEHVQQEFCTNMFYEVAEFVQTMEGNILPILQDLFMEQG